MIVRHGTPSEFDDEALGTALRDYFSSQPDLIAAYLFGSWVAGKARPDSDVDTAVLLSEEDGVARFERRLRLMSEVSEVCGQEADVVVLNDAPPLLQDQVLRHGRLIFERDRRAQVEFEVRAGKVYADLKPMYDFFTEVLFKEIKEVGLGGRRRHPARATIDDAKVYAILKKHLGNFDEYARSIATYLECRGWEKVGWGSPSLITNCK
jgi:predicted nucleotidyltransferase